MPDPLDLARCRALAEANVECPQCSGSGRVPLRHCCGQQSCEPGCRGGSKCEACAGTGKSALSTALRAACDEVERLRGENSGLQEVLRHLERKAWGGDTTISGFRKWVAERCGAALPPCDPSSQEAP